MSNKILHIYLAEDDPDDQAFITEAILHLHPACQFYTFQDGAQFSRFLSEKPSIPSPAIFLFDHNMPRQTGMELFEEIFRANTYLHVIKMLWSTSFTAHITDKCRSLGVQGFFEKPTTSDGFVAVARQILATAGIKVTSGGG